MNKKNKSIILTIVAVATLIALVVGATFAYFQATGGQAASANVNVTTYTSDLLTFTTGSAIAIYADQSNFADGLGNQTGETFARAHLLANSKTNSATANYYVYLNVTNNTFEYTQADETAELLLQVTDPNGTEVTSLSGLEYKTVTDGQNNEVKGFDVTTFDGLVTIANNYEIVANNETTQTWTVKLVFVNLGADQTNNTGKTLSANLIIQKEAETTTLADWVKAQYTTQGANNLYYHDSTLANGAGDNSYRYAGASDSVNNFVCFGSNEETCPDDNLYRIIGVFGDQVKLIKWDCANSDLLGKDGDYNSFSYSASSYSDYIGKKATINSYYWNQDGVNAWSASELNTVNLNTNFLNNIGIEWTNKIIETTWNVGGNTLDNILYATPATAYTNEYTNPAENTTETKKIGLMYTSDYGFAASPSAWTSALGNYNSYINDNWMYMGFIEWTTVPVSDTYSYVFVVYSSGEVRHSYEGLIYDIGAVRPVFYLNSDVSYKSGSGTKTNPITINID